MTEALVAIDSIEHDLELREEFKPQASHNMTTTTIAAESFTSELTPAEQVVSALRVLGVDLVLDPVTEIKATGTTTRIDAYLHQKMIDHRQDLIEMVKAAPWWSIPPARPLITLRPGRRSRPPWLK